MALPPKQPVSMRAPLAGVGQVRIFRCPPGTLNGGQFSNAMGTNCNIPARGELQGLVRLGKEPKNAEPSKRAVGRLVAPVQAAEQIVAPQSKKNRRSMAPKAIERLSTAKRSEGRNGLDRSTRPATEPRSRSDKWLDNVLLPLRVKRRTPSPLLGRIVDDGDEPVRTPKVVDTGSWDEAKAVKHVAEGGSLDDIPRVFWGQALIQNASPARDDKATRFLEIPKNGGIVGETRIFMLRDPNTGKGVGQGWVIKSARNEEDSMNEVLSGLLANAHGLPYEGAAWDGDGSFGTFVVVPHAFNHLPDGDVEMPTVEKEDVIPNYDANIYDDLSDKAMPQRFAHLLHNHLLGVSDRHIQNGMSMRVGDTPVIFPIDQGWAGRTPIDDTLFDTLQQFELDPSMQSDAIFLIQQLRMSGSAADRKVLEKYSSDMIAVYDGMLERAELVVAKGKADFFKRLFTGAPDSSANSQALKMRANSVWAHYKEKVMMMRVERDQVLSAFGAI